MKGDFLLDFGGASWWGLENPQPANRKLSGRSAEYTVHAHSQARSIEHLELSRLGAADEHRHISHLAINLSKIFG
jgi:hypothetical protein